jgi:hypothetical protein
MSQKNSPGTKREGLDPILEATIERAMAPYVGVLPAEGLRIMRERLEDALTTHPDAVTALARLKAKTADDRSGTRPRRGGGEGDAS